MRVTDEMMERARIAYIDAPSTVYVGRLRYALEAALADVPEPLIAVVEEGMGRAFYVDVVRLEARVRELEAKLAKVRSELDMPHAKHVDKLVRITAILGEESP
jgi:hypothetical protein